MRCLTVRDIKRARRTPRKTCVQRVNRSGRLGSARGWQAAAGGGGLRVEGDGVKLGRKVVVGAEPPSINELAVDRLGEVQAPKPLRQDPGRAVVKVIAPSGGAGNEENNQPRSDRHPRGGHRPPWPRLPHRRGGFALPGQLQRGSMPHAIADGVGWVGIDRFDQNLLLGRVRKGNRLDLKRCRGASWVPACMVAHNIRGTLLALVTAGRIQVEGRFACR